MSSWSRTLACAQTLQFVGSAYIVEEDLLCTMPCARSVGPQDQDLAPTLQGTTDHWKDLADRGSSHPGFLQGLGQSYAVV